MCTERKKKKRKNTLTVGGQAREESSGDGFLSNVEKEYELVIRSHTSSERIKKIGPAGGECCPKKNLVAPKD